MYIRSPLCGSWKKHRPSSTDDTHFLHPVLCLKHSVLSSTFLVHVVLVPAWVTGGTQGSTQARERFVSRAFDTVGACGLPIRLFDVIVYLCYRCHLLLPSLAVRNDPPTRERTQVYLSW